MKKKKKLWLSLILLLVIAAAVWLVLPPRPVRIDPDIQVGEEVKVPSPSGSLAGPNISVRQQIVDDLVNEWRCGGIGEDSILKKEKRLRMRLDLYAGLSRLVKIGYLSRIIDYDPVDIDARIRCPILALYGEHDTLVLTESNPPLLRAGLEKGGNINARILIIPGASHGFYRIPGKCPDWDKIEPTIAPEFRAALDDWNPFSF